MAGLAIVDSQPLPADPDLASGSGPVAAAGPGRGGNSGLSIVESKPLTLADPPPARHAIGPYGIPPGIPVAGGPILPQGQYIPTVVGYGASKLGEHFGMPDWANTAIGLAAGALTAGGGVVLSKIMSVAPEMREEALKRAIKILPHGTDINAFRELFNKAQAQEPPPPFETVKPNPAIARKMQFGGPAPTEYGDTAYKPVGMSGAPDVPPPPTPAEPWTPNKVKPAIKQKMKFGGSSDDYSAPSYRNPPSSRFSRPPDPNEVGAPPTPITPPAATSAPSAPTSAIPPDVQTGPASTPTPVAGTVRTAPELTDAKRRLFATAQELDLPGHPAGTRVPGKTMSALTESVYGPGKTVSKLSPQEMGDIHDFMVRTGKLPKPGDIPTTPASTPASTASSSGSELENTLQQSLAQIERNKRLGVGTQGGSNAK